MKPIRVETTIAAPPERVFEAFTDLENAPKRVSGIKKVEMLTPGPVRVGTKWRETRVFGKRDATEVLEVTALRAPESYSVGCTSCGCRYDSSFRFTPTADGKTKVTAEMAGEALTLPAKIFAPLFGMLMRGVMTKCVQKDLDELKAHVESE